MEQQVRGDSSSRYIIREGAAAWSNSCGESVVSAKSSGREQLHGARGVGRE
jgi:hypothetical protein